MHILIAVLHRPSQPTGVCRHAANLARCLADLDQISQVTLVTGAWQKTYFETAFALSSPKIKIFGIDIKNSSISRNLWFLFGLPRVVKQLAPNIVHLAFPLPFLKSRFPCPVVATIHDLYAYQFPENFGYRQALFNRLFFQQCIQSSDGLTCASKATLGDLKDYFPEVVSRKKTSVIYNFVDFEQVAAKRPKALHGNFDAPTILCVGQHRKNKNIDLLIKAYALLRNTGRLNEATRLIIVGSSGPETDTLVHLIQELSLENSVLLLSAIDDNELCWLYQNCQLFVIASALEGFCIPLVEALYFSCKVVCSDIPIFREIGLSSCSYFDLAGDAVKSLAQSIDHTLESVVLNKSDVHLRFLKSAIATQFLQFYSELM
ncbi:MAG: glycosyltransferase family 4 protein [Myxacorys californica WJT36-NPBG1]|jgi:glycosyltransferase involved in cell wall biosynthesis|nr:glycosyltransferase family 4 protein [Myxacorys californica WJT36-NPBG1]